MTSRIVRIALVGVACAALAVAGGVVARRVTLGTDEADAFQRLERRVRDEFRSIETSLRDATRSLAAGAELIQRAADDEAAARTLFEAVGIRLRTAPIERAALTVYSSGAQPIAWSGRPSELPPDRILGPDALFIAPGPLGLRMVYVLPVVLENRRVASIAAERVLSATPGIRATLPDSYVLDGVPVPVILRGRFEGAGEATRSGSFLVSASTGEPLLEARISPDALQQAFDSWRSALWGIGLTIVALTLLAIAIPLIGWWNRSRTVGGCLRAGAAMTATVIAGWWLLRAAFPAAWFTRFLLASLLLSGLVLIGGHALERARVARVWRRMARDRPIWAALAPWMASALAALSFILYQYFLRRLLAGSRIDVLHLSLHPFDPARLSVVFGFVFLHAAIVCAASLLLIWSWLAQPAGAAPPRRSGRLLVSWAAPLVIVPAIARWLEWPVALAPTLGVALVVIAGAMVAPRLIPRYRHASQAARLGARFGVVLLPMLAFYPVMVHFALIARRDLVEREFAQQIMTQREDLQLRVRRSLEQIDRIGTLGELVGAPAAAPGLPVPSDHAFRIWSQTDLAALRLTSAVELYARDGSLVSRFALNLPEITPSAQKWTQATCGWELFEEVSPIGSEERRLLHAGRGICDSREGAEDEPLGAIVVHAMLDYNALPFISSQSPYYELFRGD
ncbi:MAG: hypothetical protein HY654_09870, partial [Acidobacteria bacterium]|nr:hypothetical protein [Acidobacteriota bacterium]